MTNEERGRIEELFSGTVLYRYSECAFLPFARELPHLRPTTEECFAIVAETLDDLKENPDEARYTCREFCERLDRDLREAANGTDVPDEEVTLCVAMAGMFLSVCLTLTDDWTYRAPLADFLAALDDYAGNALSTRVKGQMFPPIWRRGEDGLRTWMRDYLESGDYLTDQIQEAVQGKEKSEDVPEKNVSHFRLAKKHKTNFAKIICAMYDLRMFEDTNGKIASNRQKLMDELGEFFHTDFKNLSQILNGAKQTNYTEIFDELKNKAEIYSNK